MNLETMHRKIDAANIRQGVKPPMWMYPGETAAQAADRRSREEAK